jgi:invasion protein IalB
VIRLIFQPKIGSLAGRSQTRTVLIGHRARGRLIRNFDGVAGKPPSSCRSCSRKSDYGQRRKYAKINANGVINRPLERFCTLKEIPMGGFPHLRKAAGFSAALSVALGLVIALVAMGGTAMAQGAVKAVAGDWQIRCDTPPGAQGEQCALIQSVVAEDRSNAGLTVIILKTADQKSKLMRVVAPLGVLLPSGLGLKLDDKDVGRAGFVRCLPNGCVAEVVMDDNLLGQLKTAKTATFIIFETPEEGIGFPLSLKGIGEGYDKLP